MLTVILFWTMCLFSGSQPSLLLASFKSTLADAYGISYPHVSRGNIHVISHFAKLYEIYYIHVNTISMFT